MALSPEGSTDRREAAVAAALAGAVVVVLGYASGLGLETTNQVVTVEQLPTDTSREPVVQPSDHPAPTTGVGASHHVAGHAPHRRHSAPTRHDHTPTTPATPTPSIPPEPEPEPEPPAPECEPAVVPALPVLSGLTHAVTSLLSEVVGDDLGCAVGEILDPSCCTSPSAARTRQVAR